jgi:putative tryptophan/tyrosine transport system substrate-binding protein
MVAALRKQTTTIPIVFVQVSDPVGDGFVKTLARPDSNATGFTNTISSLGGKWAELLKEAAPGVSRVGFLYNKAAAPGGGAYYLEPFQFAAAALGLQAVPSNCRMRMKSTLLSPVFLRPVVTVWLPTLIHSSQ